MAPRDEKPSTAVRRAAMNLLARREQSFQELIQKLTFKFPEFDRDDNIVPALEKLREENLQSDERFVESYVRYRRTRGMGPLKIEVELRQKGVNSGLIQSGLYSQDNDWEAACLEALEKKFGQISGFTPAEKEKCYRFLSQRGFDNEHIRLALK